MPTRDRPTMPHAATANRRQLACRPAVMLCLLCVSGMPTLYGATDATGNPTATIRPAAEAVGPPAFAPAELTVANPGRAPISSAEIRWRGGGPIIRVPLAVPPGETATAVLRLPAIALRQDYDITLRTGETNQPTRIVAEVAWPDAAIARRDMLIAPRIWRKYETDLPRWDRTHRVHAAGLAIAGAVLMVGVLILRRPGRRLAGWAIATVVATCIALGGMGMLDPGGATLDPDRSAEPARFAPTLQRFVDHPSEPGVRLAIVTSRRTVQTFEVPAPDAWPIYLNRLHLAEDDAVLTVGSHWRITQQPNEPRLWALPAGR